MGPEYRPGQREAVTRIVERTYGKRELPNPNDLVNQIGEFGTAKLSSEPAEGWTPPGPLTVDSVARPVDPTYASRKYQTARTEGLNRLSDKQ